MKKIGVLLVLLYIHFAALPISAQHGEKIVCPKEIFGLVKEDKEELMDALRTTIVPTLYGKNPKYLTYEAEVVKPMRELQGVERSYYHIAIQNCGKKVADHSWFVRLRFPKMQHGASFGEIFVVQEKQKWLVWYRYH